MFENPSILAQDKDVAPLPQEHQSGIDVPETRLQEPLEQTDANATQQEETLSGFSAKPENMLSPDMSPDEVLDVAGRWTDKMGEVRAEQGEVAWKSVLADQQAMIREELFANIRAEAVRANDSETVNQVDTAFSQDRMLSSDAGVLAWIRNKSGEFFDHHPNAKKFVAGLSVVGLLSFAPKDAEASGWLGDLVKQTTYETIRNYPKKMEQQRREDVRRLDQEQREAQKYQQGMEKLKDQYAKDSQRVVDQFDREDSRIESDYTKDQARLIQDRRMDDSQREALKRIIDVNYHKGKLKAAEKAWNGISRVEEKFIQVSVTGVSYQSQVNKQLLGKMQEIATKEVKDLAELGVDVVTVVPIIKDIAPQPSGEQSAD